MRINITLPLRYELLGYAAGGGMGDILECQDLHLGRRVIVKILKEDEEERRLLDEQKALAKLRSKHVVQLFDVIDIEINQRIRKALVLEYLSGSDLSNNKKTDTLELQKILWQVSCGLADIHKSNIIHRDIKPNNIREDALGVVKIFDFGLARKNGTEALTRSVIGTVGFMAPELWRNGEVSFDNKIDVYAFGVLALNLFKIHPPLELVSMPPQPVLVIESLKAKLPGDVYNIIMKCLSYDKNERPSMDEVKVTLARNLLKGKHRALIVMGNKTHEVNIKSPGATITWGNNYSLTIKYNGFDYFVVNIDGVAQINNKIINADDVFPECCVITLNSSSGKRIFVTFDISNPEVMS
ncbi:serine/threonine-protein kinase [Serratia fonticola]|uniref:serine/threonine-protein kinase n=1 Tax=Serratia fonticola TaxID=47917 RepID=UPI00301D1F98